MRNRDGLLPGRVFPTLLGLALIVGVSAAPAFAQDNEGSRDPMPLSYPMAAPGSLHLYHWTDYTRSEMAPGSAQEARQEQSRKEAERFHRSIKSDRDNDDYSGDRMNSDRPMYHRSNISDSDLDNDATTLAEDNSSTGSTSYDNTSYKHNTTYKKRATSRNSTSYESTSSTQSMTSDVMPSQVANDNDHIFILRGNTLIELDTADMAVIARNVLPVPDTTAQDIDRNSTDWEDANVAPMADVATTPPNDFDDTTWMAYLTNTDMSGVDQTGDIADNTRDPMTKDRILFHRSLRDSVQSSNMQTPSDQPTLTVKDNYIYVLRGSTLYQLRVSDLSLVNQTEIR
jgi:hypothetical protein